MSKPSKTRIVLLSMLVLALSLVSFMSQPQPVEAQTCASIGCGTWQYYGCCSGGSKLYQRRTCCNGPSCCSQYRCLSSACYF